MGRACPACQPSDDSSASGSPRLLGWGSDLLQLRDLALDQLEGDLLVAVLASMFTDSTFDEVLNTTNVP